MGVKRARVPGRGDVLWLDLNPTRGHEQRGRRPVLVVSPKEYNAKSGLALVCPITSHAKGYPFEIELKIKAVHGVVLVDQIRSIDWTERSAERVGAVPETILTVAQEYLRKIIFE